ncbi:hypothetical protein OIDMADRAFT_61577 [Oidiodendron maius Zn]|uniref:Major facilitator superfamily (MFS) profile domain-containing protein n=1 Tax=Oidiodendron maius (strain Zn) TaxID=913774 RepID=A0A0C3CUM7_OIDMZ|nr:hypothetical protein OIDMADRAFT_61577 [Oidiodendron maius Zn]
MFGLLSIASAWVNKHSQLAAVRFLLGVMEAGLMPGLGRTFGIRHPENTGFGPFPAGSWRTIFVLEGIITLLIGLVALILMPNRPETARFLTQEEKDVVTARLTSERIGMTTSIDKLNYKRLWRGAANPVTVATAITFLLESITVQGLSFLAPTIAKTISLGATAI